MIPRTVQMAAEVAAQFTTPQLEDYGNIILNGYVEVVPNTTNKKAWQYKETSTAPVNLPSLTQVTPALKGWTTNYQEYYTQLQPNGYGVNPGDPTMFEYTVHSFTLGSGPIGSLCNLQGGTGYFTGTHLGIPAVGGSGTGATLDLTIGVGGVVLTATLNSAGSGYTVGDGLTVTTLGPGYGFAVFVCGITGGIGDVTVTNGGSGYTPGTYPATPLTGGSGSGATADLTVTPTPGGAAGAVLLLTGGTGYGSFTLFADVPSTASTGSGTGLLLNGATNGAGAVTSISLGSSGGSGYFTNDIVTVSGTSGTPATVRVTAVSPTGAVTGFSIVNPGTGYEVGDVLVASVAGGTGFTATVTAIIAPNPAGQAKYAQPPHRLINAQVADFVPPGPNQQAIQYSGILYPVADNLTPPPIDIL